MDFAWLTHHVPKKCWKLSIGTLEFSFVEKCVGVDAEGFWLSGLCSDGLWQQHWTCTAKWNQHPKCPQQRKRALRMEHRCTRNDSFETSSFHSIFPPWQWTWVTSFRARINQGISQDLSRMNAPTGPQNSSCFGLKPSMLMACKCSWPILIPSFLLTKSSNFCFLPSGNLTFCQAKCSP